ncbi:MAG: DnaD domain protein [Clostridia bacterium]|nr:DnaD domain protein [Clostridia bacterium]
MAKMSGFIFQDRYLEQMSNLSDEELGRLVRACAKYHKDGVMPDFSGPESTAFGFIKYEIDENEKGYQARCATNKRNRNSSSFVDDGQRSSTNDDDRPRTSTKPSNIKEKNRKEQKRKKKDADTEDDKRARVEEEPSMPGTLSTGFGSIYTEEELQENLKIRTEIIPKIETVCRYCGMPFTPYDEDTVRRYLADGYDSDMICDAIQEAKKYGASTWAYIEKVLKNKRDGGNTDGSKNTGRARDHNDGAAVEVVTAEDIRSNPYLTGTI